jgi:hypothetical protein
MGRRLEIMVTELQFVAIAAFLIWCLVSSVCGLLTPDSDDARLVWREHGPAGWGAWREVHFGLTTANRRVLTEPEPVLDKAARTALLDTVIHQTRSADSDSVQFAVVRTTPEDAQPTIVYASDRMAIGSAGPSLPATG